MFFFFYGSLVPPITACYSDTSIAIEAAHFSSLLTFLSSKYVKPRLTSTPNILLFDFVNILSKKQSASALTLINTVCRRHTHTQTLHWSDPGIKREFKACKTALSTHKKFSFISPESLFWQNYFFHIFHIFPTSFKQPPLPPFIIYLKRYITNTFLHLASSKHCVFLYHSNSNLYFAYNCIYL